MTPTPDPAAGLNAAVAAEIRAELGRRGYSVQKLADMAGIPYGSLRRYVAAERMISVDVLDAIATALGLDAAILVQRAVATGYDELTARRNSKLPKPVRKAARPPYQPRPGE